jgi:VIT1/CCC1 family predicted Fe2+/Mn2+ transporter
MASEQQRKGLGFGLTSGIITTLGLMIGLNAGTHLRSAVLGGILTIAIADAFSDAFGVHVSEESENRHNARQIWEATLSTFFWKVIVALTFAVPVIMFPLDHAVDICIGWGFLLLGIYSYSMARQEHQSPYRVIGEHLTIATVVIVITNYLGGWIGSTFD